MGVRGNGNNDAPGSNISDSMPGGWPSSGGNVFGGLGQGSNRGTRNSPVQVPPSPAGNVAGWQSAAAATAANETNGFWDTEQGKADEGIIQKPSPQW